MEIKAVVFDLDGLMIDSERLVQKTWNIAGERLGYGPLGNHIYHTLGFNVARRKAYFEAQYGTAFPFDEFRRETKQAWQEAIAKQRVPAKKGLFSLLEALHKQQIKLGVATSSSRAYAMEELTDKAILSYFDAMICGDMVKEAKPSPEIYQRACAMLEVEPAMALALEDSTHGIKAAYAAGMNSIYVPDLVDDDSEIRDMILAKMKDLEEVKAWFLQQGRTGANQR